MTATQRARADRRRRAEEMDRERRARAAYVAVLAIFALLAFALAGAMDWADRTEGLGASMVPSAEWRWTAC